MPINHLNYHENRLLFKHIRQRTAHKGRARIPIRLFVLATGFLAILLVILAGGCACASQPINDNKAILAIIGEAESEGSRGMMAIACAIYNRGSLRGVYGLKSKRVVNHLYSDETYIKAQHAWNLRIFDITNGATGWGNASDLIEFKRHKWFKNCVITAHIGNHWFYKSVD